MKGVAEQEKQWHKDWDAHVSGLPFGSGTMTNEQHAQWFLDMMSRYPEETWITPEGQTVTQSPWLLALAFVEDGEKEARRFVKTMIGMAMPEVSDGAV